MRGDPPDAPFWDTCIFLAWAKDETRVNPDDLKGIAEQAEKIHNNRLHLYTSTLTLAEVLESSLSSEQARRYKAFMKRSNIHVVQITRRIAELASEIRDFYKKFRLKEDDPVMKTPDAIQLAAAIVSGCSVFYTFDGQGRKTPFPLLPLNGSVAGRPLRIEVPKPTELEQRSLFDL